MHTESLLEDLKNWQERVMADYGAGCIIRLDHGQRESANDEGCTCADSIHSHYPPPLLLDRDGALRRGHSAGDSNSEGDFGEFLGSRKRDLGHFPRVRSIIVGFDARSYSQRRDPEQVFLTLALHAAATRALELLRNTGMLPQEEPRIILERGDGALLTFTFLGALEKEHVFPGLDQPAQEGHNQSIFRDKERRQNRYLPEAASHAFSFIFALNAMVAQANARMGFLSGPNSPSSPRGAQYPLETLPIELRFAVSYDDVLLLRDINGCLNGAGKGLVACARILGSDHGGHFLVQQSLLNALLPIGGMDNVCGRAWGHDLHRAALPGARLKSDVFSYSDLFGFHTDRPLLSALGRCDLEPARYHIGSHDTRVVDR